MSHDQDKLRTALRQWRESLVNLSGRNKLLNYRATKASTLEFDRHTAEEVFGLISQGEGVYTVGTKPPVQKSTNDSDLEDEVLEVIEDFDYDRFPDHLFVDRTQLDVDRILKNLAAAARREYLDKGLNILYVAFGALRWKEESGDARRSPLLFIPVTLESDGPRQPHRLKVSNDDKAVNLALALKLREYGIELPASDLVDAAMESGGLQGALDLFRQLDFPDEWAVEDLASLSSFMFAKEAMFRDLEANESRILEHALLGAIADPRFDEGAAYLFDPVEESKIDEVAPPEVTPLVLDADSSQRVAVAAARQGRSFVLDGPPGTGKSQTISNIIGALINDGKRVLFVSEKAVALDVVRDRLSDRGLGSFVLELHSHKAARSEVAAGIARALDTRIAPARKVSPLAKPRAAEFRAQLSDYATAMNEAREPLKLSIHEAIGLIEATGVTEMLPPAEFAANAFDQATLEEIRSTAKAVERVWPVLLRGRSDGWFGIADTEGLPFAVESARAAAESLVRELDAFESRSRFGLDKMSSWRGVHDLIGTFHARAEHGLDWLTVESFGVVERNAEAFISAGQERDNAEAAAELVAGSAWRSIPNLPIEPALGATLLTALPNAENTSIHDLSATKRWTGEARRLGAQLEEAAFALTSVLGLETIADPNHVESLVWVANATLADAPPAAGWVRSEEALSKARESLSKLKAAILAEDSARRAAATFFTPAVANVPIDEIAQRLGAATGLRSWSSKARADRKIVASVAAVPIKEALKHLHLATEWQTTRAALSQEWELARDPLTPYSSAPFDEATADAFRNAEAIVHHASVVDWAGLENVLADGGLRQKGRVARDALGQATRAWGTFLVGSDPTLVAASVVGGFSDIVKTLDALDSDIDALEASSSHITAVVGDGASPARIWTIADAVSSATAKQKALKELMPGLDALVLRIAPSATESEFAQLREHLTWAAQVRGLVAALMGRDVFTPLTEAEVVSLTEAPFSHYLPTTGELWDARRDELIGHFIQERASDIASDLEDPEEALELLEYFASDLRGADAALAANEARERMVDLGVREILEKVVALDVADSEVPRYIENGALRHWLSHQLRYDRRLKTQTGDERDAIVAQFRELDHEVIHGSALEIIAAANDRKPASNYGQSALIRKEGEKKRRHIPVRELMDRSRDVIQAIHPCFMMSPLAVSQYLPTDMTFDYVIFDEASQVMPGDAVNCIYRGAALIAAGDQKQLPPTTFFVNASSVDEDSDEEDLATDYESVLDLMKSSGSFNAITLRWHYRSRHEHLIAFSNFSFYESKLITFPGAVASDEHLGVKFHLVDGTYRRSGARDNPIEAKAVAARVLNHFDSRPQESIGVVAFSAAQRDTIENALELARAARPDLDEHFAEGRLDGLFVKSLEEVQGDERDVIVLSVGYGPDENGKVYSNFGPINQKGGHRRLNVAVTRARKLVEVVSSVTAAQIGETGSEGVRHFRRYLDYAERGPTALSLELGAEGRGTDSPFEDAVIDVIRGMGFDVRPQVGVAGFRIDIGVIHPDRPGSFLLGVECDGAQYHSSRAARDRDRLRHEVLEGLGWRIHHIWGTAWYRNRDQEVERLRAVLEEQLAGPQEGRVSPRTQIRVVEIDEVESVAHLDPPTWTVPYEVTRFPKFPRVDLSDEHNARHLVAFVDAVVETEGPIHFDVLALRLREHSGVGRTGRLIRNTLVRSIQLSKAVENDGDFVSVAGRTVDRVRSATIEATRSVSQVHASELQLAVENVVRDAAGASRAEVTSAVARAFGWSRTGSEVSQAIAREIDGMVQVGLITEGSAGLSAVRE
ncbi:very-short-patch-repair endonuclease [Agromyces hippuratus]|uniref:Very-short-patch-repair endonuclease n=1 Tax=Agromyces hippuratus TaxID=286438 RepID=A0A852WY42_9MICO|nr:DUF3320 domain-containing protein [Agromyces hippuratus]NYG21170.1 very-short-patch-repair endonuclease [Agromyces hippuratus]